VGQAERSPTGIRAVRVVGVRFACPTLHLCEFPCLGPFADPAVRTRMAGVGASQKGTGTVAGGRIEKDTLIEATEPDAQKGTGTVAGGRIEEDTLIEATEPDAQKGTGTVAGGRFEKDTLIEATEPDAQKGTGTVAGGRIEKDTLIEATEPDAHKRGQAPSPEGELRRTP